MSPRILSLAFLSATILSLLSPVQAANTPEASLPTPTPGSIATPAFDTYTWLKDKFKLFDAKRDKAENRYIQDFNFFLRMQYQVEFLNPHGSDRLKGDIHNNSRHHSECWRIFRTGWNATVFENFKVTNYWNLGGMDTRAQYVQPAGGEVGYWDNRQTTYNLYRLSIDYMTKDVTYSLGKYEPLWAQEYRLSSATNVTVERSIIINQLRGECNYGVQAQNGKKDATWGWTFGTFLNGCNTSSNDVTRYNTGMYPRFNSDTNAFTLTSVTYDTRGVFATKKSRHSFKFSACLEEAVRILGWCCPIT